MKLNILMVGNFIVDFDEEAFAKEFEKRGHNVVRFSINDFFGGELKIDTPLSFFNIKQIYYRLQNKLQVGPTVDKVNKAIKYLVQENNFDFVFFYRPVFIHPLTIAYIKKRTICFAYNNDDPFSIKSPPYLWRKFISTLPYYNHIFAFREKNVVDYQNLNLNNCSLLKCYYIKENNFPIYNLPIKEKVYDVVFIGHFEDDGRDEILLNLLEKGINLKIYGPEWENSLKYAILNEKLSYKIVPIRGEKYNEIINKSKIALLFFSKINNDGYTRRSFEIPATQTFMLSEYTDDMRNMFTEDLEAVYFSSQEELEFKITHYLLHEKDRELIAKNGYNRLIKDGHEIKNRAESIIEVFNQYKTKM